MNLHTTTITYKKWKRRTHRTIQTLTAPIQNFLEPEEVRIGSFEGEAN